MKLEKKLDFIYFLFYCAAGDDGTKSKHKMVTYGMELVTTQILCFLLFITFGIVNISFNQFASYLLVLIPCPILSYFLIDKYYIKSQRYIVIIKKYETKSKRSRVIYKIITICIFVLSFVLLITGGILMSYFLSLRG